MSLLPKCICTEIFKTNPQCPLHSLNANGMTISEAESAWRKSLTPLSDAEIKELLGSTMHGSLPAETMRRVLATLSEVPGLRENEKLMIEVADAAQLRERARVREALKHVGVEFTSDGIELPVDMPAEIGDMLADAFAEILAPTQEV